MEIDKVLLDIRKNLPPLYEDIREIDIYADAIMHVLGAISDEMLHILANRFVVTAYEDGIRKFEIMLGMAVDPSLDLEVRRQKVLSKMATSNVFTLNVLKQNLKEMCDNGEYSLDLNYDTFHADLEVRIGRRGMLEALYDMLLTMLPAHTSFTIHNQIPMNQTLERYAGGVVSVKLKPHLNVVDGRR